MSNISTHASTTAVEQPVQVVQSVYEAFARKDVDGVFARFHDDITISQSEALPWGGRYRGKEEAMQFFGTLVSHIDTTIDLDRMIVAGEAVVEVGRTRGRSLATGTPFAINEVHVWRVRDGRIASMEAFVDDAAMLAAISQS